MNNRRYKFSEECLRGRKLRMFFVVFIFLPVAAYFLIFKTPEGRANPQENIRVLFLTLPIMLAVAYFATTKQLSTLKNSYMILTSEGMEGVWKGTNKTYSYQQIRRIHVVKTPSEKIAWICVVTSCEQLKLFGLETMDDFVNCLQHDNQIPMSEKHQFLDWDHPRLQCVVMCLVGGGYLWMRLSGVSLNLLTVIITIAAGVLFFEKYVQRRT